MEKSSPLISWCIMIPKPKLHLSPTFILWLTIQWSRPSPMSLQESTKTPPCLVLTMVHRLPLMSLTHPVFACSKHREPPTNGLVCLHNKRHLHNLLFLTQPNILILLLKDHFLLLVSLLLHSCSETFLIRTRLLYFFHPSWCIWSGKSGGISSRGHFYWRDPVWQNGVWNILGAFWSIKRYFGGVNIFS